MGASAAQIGKPNEAVLAFKKAISINPNNAEAYNNLGNVHKDQGMLEEAIEAFKQAVTIKPDFAEGYCNIGITFHNQGKFDDAIEALQKSNLHQA